MSNRTESPTKPHPASGALKPKDPERLETLAQAIDKVLDESPSPERVETRALAAEVIDNHPCNVYERRASFADGHVEISRIFSARDLAGLALRIEMQSEPGTMKVITERRGVHLEVSPEEFIVPSDFKKVPSLER